MNDPAFLFYSSDFLTGTMLFTDEQVGKYIRTLCYIHQHGHIDLEELKLLCKEDKIVMSKFIKDEENKYYNNRLEQEITKRKLYSDSRRNNRIKKDMNKICKTYDKHMENENDNIIISNNKDNNIKEIIKKKFGVYKRILLTNDEYSKLCKDFNKDIIDNQIEKLDEYVESNNNKNKYSNWNLVLRKSLKDNWFAKNKEQDIKPSWYGKQNKKEEMTEEELKELENQMKGFK